MPGKKQVKDIVAKVKTLNGTGLLYDAEGIQFIKAVNYRFRARAFGEVTKWSGIIAVLTETPMDVEYVLELEEEDERIGKLKLESVIKKEQKGVTVYEYTFTGVTPLM